MAPVAYGMLGMVAGVIVLAVFVGAIAGAINGRLGGELSLGAILTVGAYILVVTSVESWSSGKLTVFGMLPLMLCFLAGSLTIQIVESRLGLRPVLAVPAALGTALLAGFSYLMLIRSGWLDLTEPGTAWIALALLSCLIVLSIVKRAARRGSRRESSSTP